MNADRVHHGAHAMQTRPVQTRWVSVNNCQNPDLKEPEMEQRVRASLQLAQLARQSLLRGYWRVALRRILMVKAIGNALPTDLNVALELYLPKVSMLERSRMLDAASQWAQMTRGVSRSSGIWI